MPTPDPSEPSDRSAKRSRLFKARPDRLLVDEWVPSIALPAPPSAPLEEQPEETRLDEHGLPDLSEESDEAVRAGPARLYVGPGRRPSPKRGGEPEAEAETPFFTAELSLPRPEDGLPFGLGAARNRAAQDLEAQDEALALDGAETSDPDISIPEFEADVVLHLDPPEPLGVRPHPQASAHGAAAPAISLDPHLLREPSPTRAKRAEPAPAPAHPGKAQDAPEPATARPIAVLRSRPAWTRARPIPTPKRAQAPVFQAREAPLPPPALQRLLTWPTLVFLAVVLVAATALLIRGLTT